MGSVEYTTHTELSLYLQLSVDIGISRFFPGAGVLLINATPFRLWTLDFSAAFRTPLGIDASNTRRTFPLFFCCHTLRYFPVSPRRGFAFGLWPLDPGLVLLRPSPFAPRPRVSASPRRVPPRSSPCLSRVSASPRRGFPLGLWLPLAQPVPSFAEGRPDTPTVSPSLCPGLAFGLWLRDSELVLLRPAPCALRPAVPPPPPLRVLISFTVSFL